MLYLVKVGELDATVFGAVTRRLREIFEVVEGAAPSAEPEYAWDSGRGQYSSTLILRRMLADAPEGTARVLGITERDLFIPMLSFVFGQAQLGGRTALVSLARLRQEFYGLPPSPALLAARAGKEAMHEVGHTYELVHCRDSACVMALATNIRQLDLKLEKFCADCGRFLARRLGAGATSRTE